MTVLNPLLNNKKKKKDWEKGRLYRPVHQKSKSSNMAYGKMKVLKPLLYRSSLRRILLRQSRWNSGISLRKYQIVEEWGAVGLFPV
jgi:hypothetical protein